MDTDKIRKLAKHIRSLPRVPHRHVQHDPKVAMLRGFSMEEFRYPCGSPACIAGWAVALFGDDLLNSGNTLFDAGLILGLAPHTAMSLFTPEVPYAQFSSSPGERGHISPEFAANVLDHLADYGSVCWYTYAKRGENHDDADVRCGALHPPDPRGPDEVRQPVGGRQAPVLEEPRLRPAQGVLQAARRTPHAASLRRGRASEAWSWDAVLQPQPDEGLDTVLPAPVIR